MNRRSFIAGLVAASCSGVLGQGSSTTAAKRSFVAGEASALWTAAFSRLTSSGDIAAGPSTAVMLVTSKFGTPASRIVGTSGSAAARRLKLTARARVLPTLIGPIEVAS